LFRNGKFIGKDGGDRGYALDPAMFFVVINILENSQIPPVKPAACFCEPLKAVDI
jgi:hypothetical protein